MDPEAEAWERERHELAVMADVAELAGPLAHEINNFLNVLLLQLAVLEQSIPQDLRGDVAEVRRQGKQLGELVKHWQQQRCRDDQGSRTVPLAQILDSLLKSLQPEAAETPIQLVPAENVPPVLGSSRDIERLCRFLLTNAVATARLTNGTVTIRLASAEGRVHLRIEDGGPTPEAATLLHYFEPDCRRREGTDHLQLAACRSIVRRLRGTIRAEDLPTGGVAVVVELPTA